MFFAMARWVRLGGVRAEPRMLVVAVDETGSGGIVGGCCSLCGMRNSVGFCETRSVVLDS